jgi:adsorption protein B
MFLRVRSSDVTTREFFPRSPRAAVKQRTRWVTGIALQTWERHAWRGSWADRYWLWRDRKGLLGNPASLLANALFLYGLYELTAGVSEFHGRLRELAPLLSVTAGIGLYRMLFRACSVGRRYGLGIALAVPVRVVLANAINTAATLRAIAIYLRARIAGEPLRWVKTEHQYPSAAALSEPRRTLADVLVSHGYASATRVAEALETCRAGQRLGERLVELGYLAVPDLYEALSVQNGLPQARPEAADVRPGVARSLPRRVMQELQVLPFRIEDGKLLLATPSVPVSDAAERLRRFTRLEVRFHLVLPGQYDRLVRELL